MKLSYSSINTYETCPAKYKFQYEDRLPTTASPALSFGDVLHRTLYRFHNRPVPVAPALDEMFDMLDGEWSSDGYRDPSEERLYLDHARQILTEYHRVNADSFRIPAALEFRFTVDVDGVHLSGTIDRMDRIPGGGYEIIDYKTNRRLPPKAVVDRDLQLSIYFLAAKEIWGIEPERLTLYFLLPGQRMTTFRTSADVDGQSAALVQYSPATHGSNWTSEVGTLSFYPGCPKDGDDPFPRLPAPIEIPNPIHETFDQVVEILQTHQAGVAPVIRSTLAPEADFDGDGMTDAEEIAVGRDPLDPSG